MSTTETKPARGHRQLAWMSVSVAVFAAGVVVLVAGLAGADPGGPTPEEAAGKLPVHRDDANPATATPIVDQRALLPVVSALEAVGVPPAVRGVDAAVRGGLTAPVIAAWQQTTQLCFKGSTRSGGMCADLPGASDSGIPIQVVSLGERGLYRVDRATWVVEGVLQGNGGRLVLVATIENRLVLAYAVNPVPWPGSSEGSFVVTHLWIELELSSSPLVITAIQPMAGDPLARYREVAALGRLIAVDPSLVALEEQRDKEFSDKLAGWATATAVAEKSR